VWRRTDRLSPLVLAVVVWMVGIYIFLRNGEALKTAVAAATAISAVLFVCLTLTERLTRD
jgi:uncharacterized BrkB/YihY/UPF0761 family membrane protein